MKNRMNHVITILILSILFLVPLLSGGIVSAVGYTEFFDNDTIGNQASEGDWFVTEATGTNAVASTGLAFSGNNVYSLNDPVDRYSWFNISTVSVTSFELIMYGTSDGIGVRNYPIWIIQSDTSPVYRFEFNTGFGASNADTWLDDVSNAQQQAIYITNGEADWCKFIFTFTTDTALNITGHLWNGSAWNYQTYYNCGVEEPLSNMTGLEFTMNTLGNIVYIDDFTVNGGIPSYGQGDISGYDKYCIGTDNIITSYFDGRFLEEEITGNWHTTIRALDLFVSTYQYETISLSDDDALNDYHLYINGENIGIPSFWLDYGGEYALRWYNIDLAVDTDKLIFEFGSFIPDTGGNYWAYRRGDAPWFAIHKRHNNFDLRDNGEFDGDWPPQIQDLHMCFYWDTGFSESPQFKEDFVDVEHNSYTLWTSNQVVILTQLSVLPNVIPSYLQLWLEGVGRIGLTQGFDDLGVYIDNEEKTFSYVPYDSGNYTAQMVRNGVNITNDTFIVYDADVNISSYIWTIPFITEVSDVFTVNWYYDYSVYGESAYCLVANNPEGEGYSIVQGSIMNNGSVSYSIPEQGIYYFTLTHKDGSSYYPVSNSWQHWNGKSYVVSGIRVRYNPLYLDNILGYGRQTFYTSHPYIGREVVVYLNGLPIQNVGDSGHVTFDYDIYENGLYNATLELITENNRTVLDSVYFIVGGEEVIDIPDEEIEEDDWKDDWGITDDNALYLGWGIVLIFILLPLKVKSQYEEKFHKEVKFPAIVYLASACTGVGISIGLGLLDIWWVLLIVLSAIASILYIVVYGKKE